MLASQKQNKIAKLILLIAIISFYTASAIETNYSATAPSTNLAKNTNKTGYPSPLGSTTGYQSYSKWSILQGTRSWTTRQGGYSNGYSVASGLYYKNSSWVNFEVDFGTKTYFNRVLFWMPNATSYPNMFEVHVWNSSLSAYYTIYNSKGLGRDLVGSGSGLANFYLNLPPSSTMGSYIEYNFTQVYSQKVRVSIYTGDIQTAYLTSLEVYNDAPTYCAMSAYNTNRTSSVATLNSNFSTNMNITYNLTAYQNLDKIAVPSNCDCRLSFYDKVYSRLQSEFVRAGETLKIRNGSRSNITTITSFCMANE